MNGKKKKKAICRSSFSKRLYFIQKCDIIDLLKKAEGVSLL